MSEIRLPTLEGRTHGIVGWDPAAVQCDECLRVWKAENGTPIINTLRKVIFNRHDPGLRLCAECWRKRGWADSSAKGWIKL